MNNNKNKELREVPLTATNCHWQFSHNPDEVPLNGGSNSETISPLVALRSGGFFAGGKIFLELSTAIQEARS